MLDITDKVLRILTNVMVVTSVDDYEISITFIVIFLNFPSHSTNEIGHH